MLLTSFADTLTWLLAIALSFYHVVPLHAHSLIHTFIFFLLILQQHYVCASARLIDEFDVFQNNTGARRQNIRNANRFNKQRQNWIINPARNAATSKGNVCVCLWLQFFFKYLVSLILLLSCWSGMECNLSGVMQMHDGKCAVHFKNYICSPRIWSLLYM